MGKIIIVFIFFLITNINAKENKKNPIRECSYSWDKNVNKSDLKKLYFNFAKILLTRNPELTTDLFDKNIYPTAYAFGWHEPQDSSKLGLYFNKFDKVGDRELIILLNDKKKFYLELYLILLSRHDWQCDVNKKFKSIYYSIKNRESCRIEVTKGDSDNFYYMLKIFYKKDVYDISFTKDHKIKGIQCNNFSTEGY
jgi:hypothetical protein